MLPKNAEFDLDNETSVCWYCQACEGARFQTGAPLYAGSWESRSLVVAQNPGSLSRDPGRVWWANHLRRKEDLEFLDAQLTKTWYDWDFGTSSMCGKLGATLGDDWLDRWCYTNAVRCRTPGNAVPTPQMVVNCHRWTKKVLAGRSFVVVLGKVALMQIFPESASTWKWGRDRKMKNGSRVLVLPHPASWRTSQWPDRLLEWTEKHAAG